VLKSAIFAEKREFQEVSTVRCSWDKHFGLPQLSQTILTINQHGKKEMERNELAFEGGLRATRMDQSSHGVRNKARNR